MGRLQPWFWETWKMPPDQVEALTPRQADRFITRGLKRISAGAGSGQGSRAA